jgi:GDPmannose 4,6-dehydratase
VPSPTVAFITGITGQDGSYLAELLLSKDYVVHGLVHRPDSLPTSNICHLAQDPQLINRRLFLHNGAFEDATHLRRMISEARPAEFYHLAGPSSPRLSMELPETTVEGIAMGTLRILEILRDLKEPPRFLYASSAEVFGSGIHSPQDELTPYQPATPYGAAKAFAQEMCRIYRTAYKLKTCSAILYNHESPRRGGQFVTSKISQGVARIKRGLQSEIVLGGLGSRRDWGWAPDYVRGLWLMLQADPVDDFILATGVPHSVEDLVREAFAVFGLNWRDYVRFDPGLVTPVETVASCGNPAKARRLLGWENTVPFPQIVERLVRAQYDKLT